MVRGRTCVMKVHQYLVPSEAAPEDRDVQPFRCEKNAYRRLKAKGFCERGVIPGFYGVIENIKPKYWQPYLDKFLKDEYPLNAILMEYISGMHEMDLTTFSIGRLAILRQILADMHQARVAHFDIYPRNMMIVPGNPDRVLWIDFDRAQTFPEHTPLTPRQKEWMAQKLRWMDGFIDGLTTDHEEGELKSVWLWYY